MSLSSPTEFRELVSGRQRGVRAMLLRGMLRGVELLYSAAVGWRNRRFDAGRAMILGAGVPVVSVGNLSLGGTGKTPLVAWLARWYSERGIRVALVSRGYGAKQGQANDEARELAQQLPDLPHVQNPDRVAAAREAVLKHSAQLILLDDGFQHRRLARDLDIVLLDALEPFGFGHVFPRGTLREPLAGLARADVVALSRADLLNVTERTAIRERVLRIAPHVAWCELVHAPRDLLALDETRAPLLSLAGQRVAAFCGLGNPAGFRHTLSSCGVELADFREFPDHHEYTAEEQRELVAWASKLQVSALLCTHKDLVKLPQLQTGACPLWAVTIGIDLLTGQQEFTQRLAAVQMLCNKR